GVGGSSRVEIIWNDNAIQSQWLQVAVLPDAATGLASADVFYFGNAIGETGNSPTDAKVTAVDQIGARANPANPAFISNLYDFNRDGLVNSTDESIARNNMTSVVDALNLITVPSGVSLIPNSVVGRSIFYAGSTFDAAGHDGSMAPDKSALLPG